MKTTCSWRLHGFIAALAVGVPDLGAAETPAGQLEPCVTNIGSDGEIFRGYGAIVAAPPESHFYFTGSNDEHLRQAIHFDAGVLIYGEDDVAVSRTQLNFVDREREVLHSCFVVPQAFDPEDHNRSDLSFGTCPELRRQGAIVAGRINTFFSEREYDQVTYSWPVIDISYLDRHRGLIVTRAPGLAQFGLVHKIELDDDGTSGPVLNQRLELGGMCLMDVIDAGDPRATFTTTDDQPCLTPEGNVAQAALGETVKIQIPQPPGGALGRVAEATIADPDVIDIAAWGTDSGTMEIAILAPGISDFAMGFVNTPQLGICLLRVE